MMRVMKQANSWCVPFDYLIFHDHSSSDWYRYQDHFLDYKGYESARSQILKPPGQRANLPRDEEIELATLFLTRVHELIHAYHIASLPLGFLHYSLVS